MPNREEIHICAESLVTPTTTAADATPVKSATVDTNGYDSAHFTIANGAVLGSGAGAMTYKVQESSTDVDGNFTDAAAADVIDDGDALAANTAKRVAYVGTKRYCRLVVTPKANDVYTVLAHRGYAASKPVANPI